MSATVARSDTLLETGGEGACCTTTGMSATVARSDTLLETGGGGGGMLHHHRHVRHCCQVSPIGFPADLRKKLCKTQKKFCTEFCKGFWKEIFYNNTKFTTQKIDFLSNLPLKKTKNTVSATFGCKIGPPKFLDPKKCFASLLSYFSEFSAPWQP